MRQFFKNLFGSKDTTSEPSKPMLSDEDLQLIQTIDNRIKQFDTVVCSSYYNYMLTYEKAKVGILVTIFVYHNHKMDQHMPSRVWVEHFTTASELNTILKRFFIV